MIKVRLECGHTMEVTIGTYLIHRRDTGWWCRECHAGPKMEVKEK